MGWEKTKYRTGKRKGDRTDKIHILKYWNPMTPECFAQTQQEESSQPELLIPASLSLPHHLVSVHVHLEILPILLCTSHSHLPVEFSPFSFPQSLTHPDGSVTQTYCIVKKKKIQMPKFITNALSSGSNRNQIPHRSWLPL